MQTLTIKDKTFALFIPETEIKQRVAAVAQRIDQDMAGRTPLFLVVLNGAFMFAADLVRMISVPCEVTFIKLASYQGTHSSGAVTEVIGLHTDLQGRDVIIVEDIVDTGLTMRQLLDKLATLQPASLQVCTLLLKPGKLQTPLDLRYVAMEIPNDFIVGYGLDYDEQGRNLKDIYTLT